MYIQYNTTCSSSLLLVWIPCKELSITYIQYNTTCSSSLLLVWIPCKELSITYMYIQYNTTCSSSLLLVWIHYVRVIPITPHFPPVHLICSIKWSIFPQFPFPFSPMNPPTTTRVKISQNFDILPKVYLLHLKVKHCQTLFLLRRLTFMHTYRQLSDT